MAVDPERNHLNTLLMLMRDVEVGDPLDFSGLSINGEDARRLVALSLLKIQSDLDTLQISAAEREQVLLASAAHLVLENFLIHVRHLQEAGESGEQTMRALFARLGLGGK